MNNATNTATNTDHDFYIPESRLGYEIRAYNNNIYVRKKDKSHTISLNELKYCIISSGYVYYFQLITNDNISLEFSIKKSKDAQSLFLFLDKYASGFRNIESTYTPHNWKVNRIHYRLDRHEFASDLPKFFSTKMKPYHRIPIQSIISVTQFHNEDDIPGNYYLRIWTNKGKFYDIECNSIEHSFELACMIKDNAPHVKYGVDTFTGASGVFTGR